MLFFRCALIVVSVISISTTLFAGGGGGGGSKGGGGGSKGGGGGSKGGGGGSKGGGDHGGGGGTEFQWPAKFILSVKDGAQNAGTDLLLVCKRPAGARPDKRVVVGKLDDPSVKATYGCEDYQRNIAIRNYEENKTNE
jgi:hypothetical protein